MSNHGNSRPSDHHDGNRRGRHHQHMPSSSTTRTRAEAAATPATTPVSTATSLSDCPRRHLLMMIHQHQRSDHMDLAAAAAADTPAEYRPRIHREQDHANWNDNDVSMEDVDVLMRDDDDNDGDDAFTTTTATMMMDDPHITASTPTDVGRTSMMDVTTSTPEFTPTVETTMRMPTTTLQHHHHQHRPSRASRQRPVARPSSLLPPGQRVDTGDEELGHSLGTGSSSHTIGNTSGSQHSGSGSHYSSSHNTTGSTTPTTRSHTGATATSTTTKSSNTPTKTPTAQGEIYPAHSGADDSHKVARARGRRPLERTAIHGPGRRRKVPSPPNVTFATTRSNTGNDNTGNATGDGITAHATNQDRRATNDAPNESATPHHPLTAYMNDASGITSARSNTPATTTAASLLSSSSSNPINRRRQFRERSQQSLVGSSSSNLFYAQSYSRRSLGSVQSNASSTAAVSQQHPNDPTNRTTAPTTTHGGTTAHALSTALSLPSCRRRASASSQVSLATSRGSTAYELECLNHTPSPSAMATPRGTHQGQPHASNHTMTTATANSSNHSNHSNHARMIDRRSFLLEHDDNNNNAAARPDNPVAHHLLHLPRSFRRTLTRGRSSSSWTTVHSDDTSVATNAPVRFLEHGPSSVSSSAAKSQQHGTPDVAWRPAPSFGRRAPYHPHPHPPHPLCHPSARSSAGSLSGGSSHCSNASVRST